MIRSQSLLADISRASGAKAGRRASESTNSGQHAVEILLLGRTLHHSQFNRTVNPVGAT